VYLYFRVPPENLARFACADAGAILTLSVKHWIT